MYLHTNYAFACSTLQCVMASLQVNVRVDICICLCRGWEMKDTATANVYMFVISVTEF